MPRALVWLALAVSWGQEVPDPIGTVPPPLHRTLPLDPGPLPDGVVHATAQACGTCHVTITDAWRASAHAGPVPASLTAEAERRDAPACSRCHLPLRQQHATTAAFGQGAAEVVPHPAYDATLVGEGVTCVACHLEDGVLVGGRAPGPAPHATGWHPSVKTARACAPCHEATWGDSHVPLYDTVSSWAASPWAAAGVDCVTCHMGPGAGPAAAGHDHTMRADLRRALVVLGEDVPPALVRGAEPHAATIVLVNAGAGHHVPSGSPWTALRIDVALLGPDGARREVATMRLGQTRADDATLTLVDDTRVPPGGRVEIAAPLTLPVRDDAGAWQLEVAATRTVHDADDGAPVVLHTFPLDVR